jgi:peptidoglycan hydrolase-like protein with peptidoglycan-binding domain
MGEGLMVRLLRFSVAVVVGGLLVTVGWWAGRVALESPEDPLGDPVAVSYEVVVGSVGRSLRFAAVAEWPVVDLARSGVSGVVTSVGVEPGDSVVSGDVVFSVGLRPVTVGVGDVPMFRDLSLRAEGPDVGQVQVLLSELGFLDGEADGVFDRDTRAAVRLWQGAKGVPVDGVVRVGDVVFVPEVPVRVVLSDEVVVGSSLSGGEVTLRRLVGDPVFVIPLALEQRSLVPLDAEVLVGHDGGVWPGRIGEVREDESRGELLLVLEAADGGSLCGDECAGSVPLVGRSDYPAEIVVVPETRGPVVPVAAIETAPDGATSVRGVDGSVIPVTVVEASNGIAVVEGVSAGDVILLPVDEEPVG